MLLAQLEGNYGPRVWEIRGTGSTVTAHYYPATGAVSGYGDLRPLLGAYSDADAKAARALGVEVADVHRVAMQLWDRPLAHERDERVAAQAPDEDVSPRTLQAIRGHVTRALNRELRAALDSAKGEPE